MISLGKAIQRWLGQLGHNELGDFTATPRVVPISALAVGIGALSAFVALILLRLISLFTNLFFYGRLDTTFASPANHHLGSLVVLVPVVGALIIGLMARYGSEQIRGHGIPEAIEAILLRGSKVEPKVAFLKPLSSAISIGSGGPFGAEGPIIMTGGAFGSMIAQFFHFTSAERKTLLVAGAAGGMSATFASPVAAAVLAVELLLFEWKPRSVIPVMLASGTAAAVRRYIIGIGPLFVVPPHPQFMGLQGLAGCIVAGLLAGLLSAVLTRAVYASEDAFGRLPLHWMWWPAIGGLAIGLGGLIFPQALGVGFDTIGELLKGDVPGRMILGILLVKSTIWAVSLGSGTSGGVLAPLLMMGAALGGVEAMMLPNEGAGFWPLVSMGAVLGGTMRVPFTAVMFTLELTHDVNMILPSLIAIALAYGTTVMVMSRSILTEKLARRSYHLSREYAIDPLEILFVREVMRTDTTTLPLGTSITAIEPKLVPRGQRVQHLFPVLDGTGRLAGVITRRALRHAFQHKRTDGKGQRLDELLLAEPVLAYADEPLRVVVNRMAETGLTRFPVVERSDPHKLLGTVSLNDLLQARVLNLEGERRRERILQIPRITLEPKLQMRA